MTNELADLERTKKQKQEQRATERKRLAEAFSGSFRDTLRLAGAVLAGIIISAAMLGTVIGHILLMDHLSGTSGGVGWVLLMFLIEGVLAFIIAVISRTIVRVRKMRKNSIPREV